MDVAGRRGSERPIRMSEIFADRQHPLCISDATMLDTIRERKPFFQKSFVHCTPPVRVFLTNNQVKELLTGVLPVCDSVRVEDEESKNHHEAHECQHERRRLAVQPRTDAGDDSGEFQQSRCPAGDGEVAGPRNRRGKEQVMNKNTVRIGVSLNVGIYAAAKELAKRMLCPSISNLVARLVKDKCDERDIECGLVESAPEAETQPMPHHD